MSISIILFGILAVCIILNVPIGISLGAATAISIAIGKMVPASFLTQSYITTLDSFPLLAAPLFILAGDIMGEGGISKRLLKVGSAFFGHITGGLSIVVVVTCMFFAAISGSGPATVAAIGGIMIPDMVKKRYDTGFSAAMVASAGSIGVIIPPSIPMVMYAISTGTSIATLFIAGVIPGMLVGLALCIYSWYKAKKNGYTGDDQRYTIKEKIKVIWDAKWSLLVPVIILGGIYGGIFTPTEAAGIAVAYGLIIGLFVYKDLTIDKLAAALERSAIISATIFLIVATAGGFGKLLAVEQIPAAITDFMISLTDSKIIILLLVNILLLIVGCFLDTGAAILILSPILLPIVTGVGVDPIHFGVIMVVNLAIGFVTPPLGVNLFVAYRIAEITLDDVCKAIVGPLVAMIITLLIITYVPALSTWLPALIGG